MDEDPANWAAGGALLAAAVVAAVMATRVLLHRTSRPRSGLPGLTWLLATTALAVTGAAFWATPGRSLSHTWPFAVALVLALAPLITAAILRRRTPTPSGNADDGRRAPQ